jgi:tRNA modification GTPase
MSGFDTIAAAATPPATGAVAIIRISGPAAISIADRIFHPVAGGRLSDKPPRQVIFGTVSKPGGPVMDECLAFYFRAPKSYTGEDSVEIQCHGGMLLVSRILRLCYEEGARAALPGEFTRRALLNGKLTLTQAEAVADLIHAETSEGAQNAAAQLTGPLADELEQMNEALLAHAAHFTAYIDYTEEGIEPPDLSESQKSLVEISRRLIALSDSFAAGRLFTEGISCVLLGRPNAGKSSLLNTLANTDRAIVTDIAGTTRDTLEASANLGGVLLRLVDTAGLRESDDPVEKIGVARAKEAASRAGLILALFDQNQPPTKEDIAVLVEAEQSGAPVIFIKNKADLPENREMAEFLKEKTPLPISTKTGEGVKALAKRVQELFGTGQLKPDGSIITNRRQAEALRRAGLHAKAAADALMHGITPDVAWIDVESACSALSEVTGRAVSEDILNQVFERFCVGK